MKQNVKEIFFIIIIITLLVYWGFLQTGLKPLPQEILILYGLITFGLSFLNNKIISRIPFHLIFGMILFISLFLNIDNLITFLLSQIGLFYSYPILIGIFALIVSAGLTLLNLFKWKAGLKLEKHIILTFTILTSIIYLIYGKSTFM